MLNFKWKPLLYVILLLCLLIYTLHNFWITSQQNLELSRSYRSKEGPFIGYKDCNPEQDIVFHKTHKCSSSSVQNILLRYALKHELNIALPKSGNYLGRKSLFNVNLLKGTPWQIAGLHYNIFCLHNRWNGAEVDKLMGRMKNQRPVYFTILRDPVDLFISLWDYLELGKIYNGITLEEFALSNKQGEYQDRINQGAYGRNQMLWDFGLSPAYFDNATAIKAKIDEIDSTFDLVLLTEKYSESMILLKDLLCWDYGDLTSLTLNAHDEKTKSKVSREGRKRLQEWMEADYFLYNHFKEKFELEVDSFGRDQMQHELEILNHANQVINNRCGIEQVNNKDLPPENRLFGHGVLGYKMNTDDTECTYMGMKEVKFLDILREIQTKRAEEASGINFDQDFHDPKKFKTLGNHVSLDELKELYKFKGPNNL